MIAHGVTSNKNRPYLVRVAERLAAAGVPALRFTFAGNTGSGGRFEDCTPSREVDDLRDAYEVIARLRLTHQLARLDVGAPPDNFINPQTLGNADRLLLKQAFKTIAWLQRWVEDRFQTGLIG